MRHQRPIPEVLQRSQMWRIVWYLDVHTHAKLDLTITADYIPDPPFFRKMKRPAHVADRLVNNRHFDNDFSDFRRGFRFATQC